MVQAISARYGTATRLYPEIALPAKDEYSLRRKIYRSLGRLGELGDPFPLHTDLNSFELTSLQRA